jgi:hypothetical protein
LIHFVVHLQGLHARYLIGRLLEEGVFDTPKAGDRPAVRPVSFVTLSTPHLGSLQVGSRCALAVCCCLCCDATLLHHV